jgi:hypothetical protein
MQGSSEQINDIKQIKDLLKRLSFSCVKEQNRTFCELRNNQDLEQSVSYLQKVLEIFNAYKNSYNQIVTKEFIPMYKQQSEAYQRLKYALTQAQQNQKLVLKKSLDEVGKKINNYRASEEVLPYRAEVGMKGIIEALLNFEVNCYNDEFKRYYTKYSKVIYVSDCNFTSRIPECIKRVEWALEQTIWQLEYEIRTGKIESEFQAQERLKAEKEAEKVRREEEEAERKRREEEQKAAEEQARKDEAEKNFNSQKAELQQLAATVEIIAIDRSFTLNPTNLTINCLDDQKIHASINLVNNLATYLDIYYIYDEINLQNIKELEAALSKIIQHFNAYANFYLQNPADRSTRCKHYSNFPDLLSPLSKDKTLSSLKEIIRKMSDKRSYITTAYAKYYQSLDETFDAYNKRKDQLNDFFDNNRIDKELIDFYSHQLQTGLNDATSVRRAIEAVIAEEAPSLPMIPEANVVQEYIRQHNINVNLQHYKAFKDAQDNPNHFLHKTIKLINLYKACVESGNVGCVAMNFEVPAQRDFPQLDRQKLAKIQKLLAKLHSDKKLNDWYKNPTLFERICNFFAQIFCTNDKKLGYVATVYKAKEVFQSDLSSSLLSI